MLAVQCASVFTCMCVFVHVCTRQPGSLWPHHHCVSQPQPVQTCTLSCQPQCTFSVSLPRSRSHNHSLGLGVLLGRRGKKKQHRPDISLNSVSDSTNRGLFVLKFPNCVFQMLASTFCDHIKTLSHDQSMQVIQSPRPVMSAVVLLV